MQAERVTFLQTRADQCDQQSQWERDEILPDVMIEFTALLKVLEGGVERLDHRQIALIGRERRRETVLNVGNGEQTQAGDHDRTQAE